MWVQMQIAEPLERKLLQDGSCLWSPLICVFYNKLRLCYSFLRSMYWKPQNAIFHANFVSIELRMQGNHWFPPIQRFFQQPHLRFRTYSTDLEPRSASFGYKSLVTIPILWPRISQYLKQKGESSMTFGRRRIYEIALRLHFTHDLVILLNSIRQQNFWRGNTLEVG